MRLVRLVHPDHPVCLDNLVPLLACLANPALRECLVPLACPQQVCPECPEEQLGQQDRLGPAAHHNQAAVAVEQWPEAVVLLAEMRREMDQPEHRVATTPSRALVLPAAVA